MPDLTNDNDNDIDALLRFLDGGASPWWADSVRALLAERNALKRRVAELSPNRCPPDVDPRELCGDSCSDLDGEMLVAMRRGGSHPPAASDLRERLVRAIWPELLRIHTEYAKIPGIVGDPREQARRFALIEADEMIAAMRKEEADA